MEEGVLVRWVKKEGDKVSPGDLVAEVETDKANMDMSLEDEGVLLKLLVKEGDTVKLGAPVAILGEAGEDVTELEKQAAAGSDGTAAPAKLPEAGPGAETSKEAPAQAEAAPAKAAAEATPAKAAEAPEEAKDKATGNRQQATGNRQQATGILASPIAKTLAAEHGVD